MTQTQTQESHTGTVVPQSESTAIAQRPREPISGTYHDAKALDAKLKEAAHRAHLISPFTSAGALPEGFGVRLTAVMVDVKNETYPIPGPGPSKRGLSKAALDKLGHALGLSWNPQVSGRLDDGRDPRYCRYRAVGSYMGADGIRHVVSAEKEMDLRDGSPTIVGLIEKAKSKDKDATGQIRELRMHIVSHAETKARLRAIRSMGIRTSYGDDELTKPFVAVQVTFTGHTSDPALRTEFSKMIAANALGGTALFYPPTNVPMLEREPAPPVGELTDGDDDDDLPLPASTIDRGDDGERW